MYLLFSHNDGLDLCKDPRTTATQKRTLPFQPTHFLSQKPQQGDSTVEP
jgi:hypothetical protein